MKIYFLNMGNSSISGGFSSYSRFISELQVDNQIIKFSDFGTKDKNSINVFFRTVGLEKFNLISSILHKINQMTYVMVFIGLLAACLCSNSKIWIQSSYLSKSRFLRILAFYLGRETSLIIDVRDKEFFPFLENFSKYRFISCGQEINQRISHFTKKNFNLKTPISKEDLELVNIVKNQKYIVYAHGIQKDKSPEQLLKFLKIIEPSNYLVLVCGRIRSHSSVLLTELLNHKKLRYVGNLDKLVLLSLLKNSAGVLITGEKEGVPRILEEAKNFSIPVITTKSEAYLSDYEKKFTFNEFSKSILNEKYKKIVNNDLTKIQDKLAAFLKED